MVAVVLDYIDGAADGEQGTRRRRRAVVELGFDRTGGCWEKARLETGDWSEWRQYEHDDGKLVDGVVGREGTCAGQQARAGGLSQ